ncbi:helix-turn-helix transcriptional regulator [Pseudoalteromonas sp. Z1A8]|uniref:helix-turn-helix domain-containing protein n=1 Tax=Pseudoalteromonas sp. Z1A8 TaxID=2686354 RepID=UPI001F0EB0F5|nr:helix-turn-helix transcriptional regulator [Pseudoalteromonas sp. Z1A8]
MSKYDGLERLAFLAQIESDILNNEIEIGDAVRLVRTKLYKMSQTRFANYVKVSDRTLRDIEKNNTDPRLSILKKSTKTMWVCFNIKSDD